MSTTQVALVVSGINLSNYCLAAHLEILGRLGIDKAVSRKLALNYESAPVEPKVMELFRFADKLSRRPADMEKSDVDLLREAGWNDDAILETILVVSLYACANRFSAGVGLVANFWRLRIGCAIHRGQNTSRSHRFAVSHSRKVTQSSNKSCFWGTIQSLILWNAVRN